MNPESITPGYSRETLLNLLVETTQTLIALRARERNPEVLKGIVKQIQELQNQINSMNQSGEPQTNTYASMEG